MFINKGSTINLTCPPSNIHWTHNSRRSYTLEF
ncbi:Protein of unknown function [Gryllus bimaculatus]|nr:Protein of unknown function [Gryllus bimaculatus]